MSKIPESVTKLAIEAADEFVRMNPSLANMKAVIEYQTERTILNERNRLAPLLAELYTEVVWNAYNTGIVKSDGNWIDGAMSDAEILRDELGLSEEPHDAKAVQLMLPVLIARKVAEAIE